jgi:ribosome-associated translation inhibitor RaiA
MDFQVDTRNLDLHEKQQKKIEDEKNKILKHHAGQLQGLRVVLEDNPAHKQDNLALKLVASVKNDTIVVNRTGSAVQPLLTEGFDVLRLQLKELQRKRKNL